MGQPHDRYSSPDVALEVDEPNTLATPPPREAFARRAAWLGLSLLVLAAAATILDLPVARQFRPRSGEQRFYPALGQFTKVVNLCEAFGYGGTVLLLVLLAGRLDPAGLRAMPRLLAGAFGGGLAANLVKSLVGRTRPKASELDGNVLVTFEAWLPMLDGATRIHNLQSFPSAHTATAFGLATVLSWRSPRGGPIFFLLAAAAGLQRIQVMDHFVSDVLCGAGLGILCGAVCISQRLAGGWFDRLESVALDGRHPLH